MQGPQFDHEKLDVYRLSITFVGHANSIVREFPSGNAPIADQLMRAATSVSLNIAEGAGEYSGKEKARFYRMAKRSATECAAVLDVCKELDLAPREALTRGREQLLRIVSMLVKLTQAVA
jgi:four helix bundle protein